jgi:hypothetical protein
LWAELPDDFGQLTLISQGSLSGVQRVARQVDRAVWAISALTLVLLALTIAVSPHRRRTLVQLSLGVVAGIGLAAILVRRLEAAIVAGISDPDGSQAVRSLLAELLADLRNVTLLMVGTAPRTEPAARRGGAIEAQEAPQPNTAEGLWNRAASPETMVVGSCPSDGGRKPPIRSCVPEGTRPGGRGLEVRDRALQTHRRRTRHRPGPSSRDEGRLLRVPVSTVPATRIGLAIGGVAAYLVAGSLFRSANVDVRGAIALVGVYGLSFGIAGASLAVGRRADARTVMAIALLALLADPLRLLFPLYIPRGVTLLTVDNLSASGVTVLLAATSAVGAWLVHRRRAADLPAIPPWLVGGLVCVLALAYGTRPGFDPDAWPGLALYAVAVGLGAAAVPIGVYGKRRGLTWLGWIAVGGLPALHSAWFLDSPDPEAWTVVYLDLIGIGISLVAGGAVAIALLRRALRHRS